MAKNPIEDLKLRMQLLITKQNELSQEIREMQHALNALDSQSVQSQGIVEKDAKPVVMEAPRPVPTPAASPISKVKPDWEKFIGENLISKIGIVIMVIGVGIGTKYAIDHEMISPLTRLILGYVVAAGLLGFSLRLRKTYEAYSAVLLSGALAIMYFLTFSGYSFYGLFPKGITFGCMVALTICTVYAAIKYNRPIIAHMGFVGSYAVPFLLSDGTGKPLHLFIYMVIINSGILYISFKRYWKSLYYAAFVFTWVIYMAWFLDRYNEANLQMALTFLSIFYLLFYTTFLANKLLNNKPFMKSDILLVLSNSFTFYAIGFALLSDSHSTEKFLGLFTILNAVLHLIVGVFVKKVDPENKKLFALIVGFAIVFLTLTIPVQLEGGWITLLWVGEAVLLFWIGRTKNAPAYEQMAYPLVLLSFASLTFGWMHRLNLWSDATPFANVHLLISLLYVGALAVINWVNQRYAGPVNKPWAQFLLKYVLPALLLISTYASFVLEISAFWNQVSTDSSLGIHWVAEAMKYIWVVNYSLLFLSALAFINHRKIHNGELMHVNLGFIILAVIGTFKALDLLGDLREYYLSDKGTHYLLWIRYIVYGCFILLIFATTPYFGTDKIKREIKNAFELLLYTSILWMASSELIHWLALSGYQQSDKLALSILWGIASLIGIVLGITQTKKHLRIGAIVLFGVALCKLFFYDISHLDTLSKTIVFVTLGILLLVISFLYNRFKQLISEEKKHN